MSITIVQHDPDASVRIGGPNDIDGEPGMIVLEVQPFAAQLKPSTARQVARKVAQFAGLASDPSASAAARALGAFGASKAGKASHANKTPEERSQRAREVVRVRWDKYRAEKGGSK